MRLLTFKELRIALGGRGRTTIYRDVAAGRLPKPLKLGGRVYWKDKDVKAALQNLEETDNEH